LIDENNEMLGVVDIEEAIERAREAELDLVEVAPESDPPVCRILDYGKYRYEQSKKDKATKAKSKSAEMKEVRLGRSMKIDPHDIQMRLNQARQFLMKGHKVQIVQNFRGREMIHRQRGYDRMKDITEKMSDIAKVEMPPRPAGRRLTMILAPDRAKIDQIKRREEDAKRRLQAGAADAPGAETGGDEPTPKPEAEVTDTPAADAAETVEVREA
jgi:translation initiation factor IF-3